MKLAVIMKHPSGALSPNGAHGSWQATSAARRKLREQAQVVTRAAMREKGLDVFTPRSYSIVWHYKGNVPDCDNVVARCKSIIDGACDAFGINDRVLDIAGVRRVHDKAHELCGYVRVVFDDGREEA